MSRRPSGSKSSAVPPQEDALLERLGKALSDEEIRHVLGSALLALDDTSRKRLCARLAPETSAALVPVLDPPPSNARGSKTPVVVAGKGKFRQEWDRLWAEWEEVVAESGDEEGKYVQQDHDWEAPYSDPSSISEDLDAIASRMLPLIPRAISEGLASEFSFAEALGEANDNLYAGLPDWMDAGHGDPCCLGPQATECLLEWEWTVAHRKGCDAAAFLDGIRDLEDRLTKIELDGAAITKFVLGLSEEQQRDFLASMKRQRSSARWSSAFARAHGFWADIMRSLARRLDRALLAETSRANIPQDWTLALPLVKDAVKRNAFAEAAALVDEAVRSCLRLNEGERWDPRKELFVQREGFRYDEDRKAKLARLLRYWHEIAVGQGQEDLTAALALQIVAFENVESGKRMLDAFRRIPQQFHPIRDALFADWRALVVRRSFHQSGKVDRVECGEWLPALVDAALAETEGAAIFHSAVRASIEKARANAAAKPSRVEGRWWVPAHQESPCLLALAVLTRDLDATAPTLKESAPNFWKVLPRPGFGERDGFAATRRDWCQALAGRELLPELMAFWREHAWRFVPDPGAAASNYSQSTDWLAAVHELNPKAAEDLLARWATAYHLKRNLWRDLGQRGLPIPPGVRVARSQRG